MQSMIGPLLAIIIIVLAANFFIIFKRLRNNPTRRTGKPAINEAEAAEQRDIEIQRRFQQEFEDDLRRVELRNKTLELYDLVRKRAVAAELEDDSD